MTAPMTDAELAEAKRLCERATDEIELVDSPNANNGYGSATHEPSPASIAFYSAARTLVPRLLAEVARLKAERTDTRRLLADCARKLGYLIRDYPGDKEAREIVEKIKAIKEQP